MNNVLFALCVNLDNGKQGCATFYVNLSVYVHLPSVECALIAIPSGCQQSGWTPVGHLHLH